MMAPRLNRMLTLETPLRVSDGAGGTTEDWQALGTLHAEVRPGSGGERSGIGTSLSRVPMRIIVRGAPVGAASRPVAGQRFREGSRLYDVIAVTEYDPEGRFLTCHSQEETGR